MSDFQRRGPEETVNKSSERQFGLVMAGFFALLAFLALWRGHGGLALGWSGAALAFAGMALLVPALLKPLNALWFRFGLVLHKVMTPLIMGAMFFLVFTSIGLMMRLFGKRPIAPGFDRAAQSYWIARDPAGPGPMTKQY
ncbi:SxtJ family membrane protein [Bosea sp. (in: a-proteobacteria)]|uniref:SxtJ family membrane protein n=1 Tax=Bosea sp. (in: a-proteobacteria) TaxID=1871050 RepID=UPI0026191CD2|nr:SxtJ family membrane protein [Bosea sp. (in: a-proteobacteria)]MCO5089816.1 SxtJ family membrane protein [Bosea sp. (in: a-proteobacteria)]